MKNKEKIIKALINIGMIILSINLFIVLCFGFSPYRIKTGNINFNNPIFDITYIIAPVGFIITFIGIIISYISKPKILSSKECRNYLIISGVSMLLYGAAYELGFILHDLIKGNSITFMLYFQAFFLNYHFLLIIILMIYKSLIEKQENPKTKNLTIKDKRTIKKWKIIQFIGLSPTILLLLQAVVSMFAGFDFLGSRTYGLEALQDTLIFYGIFYGPFIIIGLIIATIATIRINKLK